MGDDHGLITRVRRHLTFAQEEIATILQMLNRRSNAGNDTPIPIAQMWGGLLVLQQALGSYQTVTDKWLDGEDQGEDSYQANDVPQRSA